MKAVIEAYQNSKRLHHAYCLVGEYQAVFENLLDFFEKHLSFPRLANPDLWIKKVDTFSIAEAREIKEQSTRLPVAFDRRIFIIGVSQITREAQNALLKSFEDPTKGVHFFLIIDSAERLLPTLRSRMVLVDNSNYLSEVKVSEGNINPEDFVRAPIERRLQMIQPIIEDDDKSGAIAFISSLEIFFFKMNALSGRAEILEELVNLKKYLYDRSPSVKLILEHIALVTPIVRD